jgi:cellulose synthase/poly-beta-1,6-N-acetylglucosamine synthase-like glycosyltransferase
MIVGGLVFAALALVLSIAYFGITNYYCWGWNKLPAVETNPLFQAVTRISVIVAARNEAEHIEALLASLQQQNYPHAWLEVIVVDDFSTDTTAELVAAYPWDRVRLIRLADQSASLFPTLQAKKRAISIGIAEAQGDLIVTTDSDCNAPPTWLTLLVTVYQSRQPQFISAPVVFWREKNLLQRFQSLDFLGMMVITGAGIHTGFMRMGNGANLAFPKKVFEEVGGYLDSGHLASGDDMFLLHKIAARYPEGVFFLKNKNAAINTEAKPDLKSFVQQRLRWSTKSASYREWQVTAVLAVVFFHCWCILLTAILIPWQPWLMASLLAAQLLLKSSADYRLLRSGALFFQRPDLLRIFWPAQGMHIVYIAGIGLLANLVKEYEWKGRRTR